MKKIKNIEISNIIFFLFLTVEASFMILIFIAMLIDSTKVEKVGDRIRKCETYSTDFWRSDVAYIDGKCYYKGKEVEIR